MPSITTAGGAVIAYDLLGDGLEGTPFLLIEGLSAHYLGWRDEFCQKLVDAGHRVVRFDNRDIGKSQRYPGVDYTLGDMADDAKDLIDALGIEQVHVLGQSMGGMIAQELALRHPGAVRSLAVLYTAPSVDYLKPSSRDLTEMASRTAPSSRAEAVDRYVHDERECASTAYPFDEAWKRTLGGLMWDRSPDGIDGVVRQRTAVGLSRDRLPLLGQISCPTLVMHGTADALVSEEGSRAIAGAVPGSRLRLYEGMGHELPRDLWDELVAEIVDNARRPANCSIEVV